MTGVFVSYAREDRSRVERIVASLERQGFPVFWDREIPPGSTWDQVLEQQLKSADCVLVLWSKQSVDSDWVKTEAAEAKRLGKFLPALLDDVAPPLEFRRVQAARLVNWSGQQDDPEFRRVIEAITALGGPVGVKGGPVVGKTTRPAWPRIATVAILVIGVVAAAWFALKPGPTPAVQFSDADGECPSTLPGTRLTVTLVGDSTTGVIDDGCRFPLPASADKADLASLVFAPDPNAGFVIDRNGHEVPEDFPKSPVGFLVVATNAPRVEIALLPYSGLESEGPRKIAFDEFRGILEDKLTNLVQELAATPELARDEAAQQLAKLKLNTLSRSPSDAEPAARSIAGVDLPALDLEQKLRIWRQRHSLGLLTGTLSEEVATDRRRYRVDSQIFIGDLDGAPLGRSIPLMMQIGPEEFSNTRDTHALALLYALALDARRLGYRDDVVTVYLSKAYSIARGLRESVSGGTLPEPVERIADQVEAELSQMARRARQP